MIFLKVSTTVATRTELMIIPPTNLSLNIHYEPAFQKLMRILLLITPYLCASFLQSSLVAINFISSSRTTESETTTYETYSITV